MGFKVNGILKIYNKNDMCGLFVLIDGFLDFGYIYDVLLIGFSLFL